MLVEGGIILSVVLLIYFGSRILEARTEQELLEPHIKLEELRLKREILKFEGERRKLPHVDAEYKVLEDKSNEDARRGE